MTIESSRFTDLLRREVAPALGCTEPVAVALTAAKAAKALGKTPEHVEALVSGNLLKNGMGVGVPGTGMNGLPIAAAAGAVGGDADAGLEVLKGLTPELAEQAKGMLSAGKVALGLAQTSLPLYAEVRVMAGEDTALAVLKHEHTGIVHIERNGRTLFHIDEHNADGKEEEKWPLNVDAIYEFSRSAGFEEIAFILEAARLNETAAAVGLEGDYGLGMGRSISEAIRKGVMSDDLCTNAVMLSCAATDVRMSGAPYAVMSNSGSGNQGLTCTLPVVAFARRLEADDEALARALVMSHLMSIHIKHSLGRLSALCGATVAGTAAACGIVLLLGGKLPAIRRTVHNMVGSVTGMVCDGAKNGCALKVAASVNAGIQAAMLAMNGTRVTGKEGVVDSDVEQSIRNFGLVASRGMTETDKVMLDIMVNKACKNSTSPSPQQSPSASVPLH